MITVIKRLILLALLLGLPQESFAQAVVPGGGGGGGSTSPGGSANQFQYNGGTFAGSSFLYNTGTGIAVGTGTVPAPTSGAVVQFLNPSGNTRVEADAVGFANFFTGVRYDGTVASPTALASGDQIAGFNSCGYNGSAVQCGVGSFAVKTAAAWSTTSTPTQMDFLTTPIGTSTGVQAANILSTGVFQENFGITAPTLSLASPLGLASGGTGSTANTMQTNLEANTDTKYPNFRAALAKTMAGLSPTIINEVGDSVLFGGGGALRVTAPCYLLAKHLSASGIPAECNGVFGSGNSGPNANYQIYDPRMSFSGSSGYTAFVTVGGTGWYVNAGGVINTAFYENQFDSVDIYYTQNTGFGSFTVSVDGGATLATINENGSPGIGKTTVSVPVGYHTLTFTGVTSTGYIIGWEPYLSTFPKVRVRNMGWGGARTTEWVTTGNPWSPFTALSASTTNNLGANLSELQLGSNDWFNGGNGQITPALYTTQLASIISNLQTTGDVQLMVPSYDGRNTAANILPYITGAFSDAAAAGLTPVDYSAKWVSYSAANALGLFADVVHPSLAGYQDRITSALLNVALAPGQQLALGSSLAAQYNNNGTLGGSSYVALGTTSAAALTNTGTETVGALTVSGITGSTQCLQIGTTGIVSGTGSACGSGGGGTPAGSQYQIQMNSGSSTFAGSSLFDNGTVYTTENLGIGTTAPAAQIHQAGNLSAANWTTSGIAYRSDAATYLNTTSSGSVAGVTAVHSFGVPVLTATSATTYANTANVYIAGAPSAGSGVTQTAAYGLYNAGTTLLSGNATVVGTLTASSQTSFNTAATAGNLYTFLANSCQTCTNVYLNSAATGGTTGTTDTMLSVNRSGINSGTNHTALGESISVTNTNATSGTNTGLTISASGATTANYGLLVTNGNSGFGISTPGTTLVVNGGWSGKRTTVADTAYTVLATDQIIAFTSLTATRTVTNNCSFGTAANPQYFIVKDEAGTAGTNNITFVNNIDGAATAKIATNYGSVRYYANGTGCFTW